MKDNPQKIGKYEIVAQLGQGPIGIVYKAFDPMAKRFVALKTIDFSSKEPPVDGSVQRFLHEAQTVSKLIHQNIVRIFEFGQDAGRAFIAMEYVEGPTLDDLFKQKYRFPLTDINMILTSVLAALDYSDRMGVIHCDIKPGNIMLDSAGTVKVMDFGIARIVSSVLTQNEAILGTPGYMSPEQLLGETVGPSSDLYSAGIVLHELLTGERVFTGSSVAAVIYKVVHSGLFPPSHLNTNLPVSLDSLVLKACSKKSKDRYQTTSEFSVALNRAIAMYVKEVGKEGEALAKPDSKRSSVSSTIVHAPQRLRKWVVAATLLAGATGIALYVWLAIPPGPEQKQTASALPGTVFKDCDKCPEMIVIPAGHFIQGTNATEMDRQVNEGPMRQVTIDYALAVSRYEITKAEFAFFATESGHFGEGCYIYNGSWKMEDGRSWRSPGFDQDDKHPVTCISWNYAQSYVRWLTYKTDHKYRLLSSSEWEYAALSGGSEAIDPTRLCESANVADRSTKTDYPGWEIFDCQDNFVHTAPVGSYRANAFGIYDMIGNVFEWVTDCWNDNYDKAPLDGTAWVDGDCGHRILRGGSWFTSPQYVRVAFRNRFEPDYRSSSFGFRVARLP